MAKQEKSLSECSFEELDRELIARGGQVSEEERFKFVDREGTFACGNIMKQTKELYHQERLLSPDDALSHLGTWELVEELLRRIKKAEDEHLGLWGEENRMDYKQITNKKVKHNADCIAAICMKNDMSDKKSRNGFSTLKHKNFGKTFNLCDCEKFFKQPIVTGRLCTGFLVEDNVIATAGHCADEKNLTHLRFVFGFNISDSETLVTQVPNEKIYKGIRIIDRVYDPKGSGADWALVELDRKVVGQTVATLSKRDISLDQPVYTLGHPCGLPLKYSAGARVRKLSKSYFSANLSVYSGNSGSPVFNHDTHEVVGIVARGDCQDFRWTGRGWLSIIYPNRSFHSKEPQCTKVSEFIESLCNQNNSREK